MDIFVWGTGFASQELLENELHDSIISGFIDNNPKDKLVGGVPVYTPNEVLSKKYDVVIVATGYSKEIYDQALTLGFDVSKFFFIFNNIISKDMNEDYSIVRDLLPKDYIDFVKSHIHLIRGMMIDREDYSLDDMNRHGGMFNDDYVRIRTFELVVKEIERKNVEGNVAELGVFQGDFARYINMAFPNRICYLFDTFESFRPSELILEMERGNAGEALNRRFMNTSVERVVSRMPNKDQIVCKKGFFPESLNGLEDRFAFVSLDVDFEQAIYDGLEYFYPRLNKGGYMFVHDYNSYRLKGVSKAIATYEEKSGIQLVKVPLPDLDGTIVISK